MGPSAPLPDTRKSIYNLCCVFSGGDFQSRFPCGVSDRNDKTVKRREHKIRTALFSGDFSNALFGSRQPFDGLNYQSEEQWYQEGATSLSIEYQLRWLARWAGTKNSDFLHGIAACFDDSTPTQRSKLYRVLMTIEECSPRSQKPIDWSRFLRRESGNRVGGIPRI